eukprot:TRINITY_DN109371_c0_g1_i1.p1 TRINITY_DN109371_c0_g1~~TRINITY_DN109371_c0_g1_i1.p1  ORF type:complete len:126 (+),score=11.64 TRINITY_DN109371_c0_g1_i1:107-484(+)
MAPCVRRRLWQKTNPAGTAYPKTRNNRSGKAQKPDSEKPKKSRSGKSNWAKFNLDRKEKAMAAKGAATVQIKDEDAKIQIKKEGAHTRHGVKTPAATGGWRLFWIPSEMLGLYDRVTESLTPPGH